VNQAGGEPAAKSEATSEEKAAGLAAAAETTDEGRAVCRTEMMDAL